MFRGNLKRRSWVKEKICQVYDAIDYARLHPISTLRKQAHEETIEFILQNCPKALGLRSSRQLLDYSLEKVAVAGAFMEFGVYKGASLNHIAKHRPDQTIHGFDSFFGLAKDWVTNPESTFSVKGQLPKVLANVRLHQGYFDQTLPQWVENYQDNVAFLHIDCDLYSSTVTVFDYLKDRLQPGTIIVFDDYFNFVNWKEDGHKAFRELIERERLTFNYLGYGYKELAVQLT
ncbi:MAG: class I SAM-dependent methyltransferase [Chloroflexota bacterium]